MLHQNAIYIPEDDLYLISSHVHDYREHKLRDGKIIAVDGGKEYARRAGDLEALDDAGRYHEYLVTDIDPFEPVVVDRLLWGTRGKDGKSEMRFRPIKELAHAEDGINHMQAILDNCLNISPLHKRVVEYWIAKRKAKQG